MLTREQVEAASARVAGGEMLKAVARDVGVTAGWLRRVALSMGCAWPAASTLRQPLTKQQRAVLDLWKAHPSMPRREMARLLNTTTSCAKTALCVARRKVDVT